MKYYLAQGGGLYAFKEDGSQDAHIKPGMVLATPEQVAAIQRPPKTVQQSQAELTALLQRQLDATAQSRGYDHMLSLCSYTTSSNARFAAEARAGVNYRDAMWLYGLRVVAEVQAGTRPVPGEADLLHDAPSIVWPDA